MKKFFHYLYMFVTIAFFAWCILSWAEITLRDFTQPPDYSPYNLIILLSEWAGII